VNRSVIFEMDFGFRVGSVRHPYPNGFFGSLLIITITPLKILSATTIADTWMMENLIGDVRHGDDKFFN